MARRDNREYRTYLRAEQRRQRGCIARRMQRHLRHGLPGRAMTCAWPTSPSATGPTLRAAPQGESGLRSWQTATEMSLAPGRCRSSPPRLARRPPQLALSGQVDLRGCNGTSIRGPLGATRADEGFFMLSLERVISLVSEAAEEFERPRHRVIATTPAGRDGAYIEVIVSVADCPREPCRLLVGLQRDKPPHEVREDIVARLREHSELHR